MKEQIEEMAKALMKAINEKNGHTSMRGLAEALYNAGYRKQKEGEWLPTCDTHPLVNKYACSCCGEESMRGKYCPNCGAKMKGGA